MVFGAVFDDGDGVEVLESKWLVAFGFVDEEEVDVAVEEPSKGDYVAAYGRCRHIVSQLLIVDRYLRRFQLIRHLLLLRYELRLLLQYPENEILLLAYHNKVEVVEELY